MLWSEYVNTEEYFPAKITQIVTLIIIDYIRDREGEGGGEKNVEFLIVRWVVIIGTIVS